MSRPTKAGRRCPHGTPTKPKRQWGTEGLTAFVGRCSLVRVEEELSQAIALLTAWAAGEVETWTALAQETLDGDPMVVLRQMSLIVMQLAETIAEKAGGNWSVNTVLQHLALDSDEDGA